MQVIILFVAFSGIARLVSALLATNHQAVNARLVECRTLDALLDLFFKYSLNNFLHSTVEGCLAQVSDISISNFMHSEFEFDESLTS